MILRVSPFPVSPAAPRPGVTLAIASAIACAAALPAGAAPAEAAAVVAEPVPVVVAVDTSRSLSAAETGAAAERLRGALSALPAGTPAGLLAFDDRPRWVRPLGAEPAAVAAALGELRPAGRFTLLHDALFAAARALPDGGVVIVATDGRDENSATTVDDIARRCEAQGVRILTLGAGARQEERLLRRLALLTDGAYLGAAEAAPAAEIARAVEAAREGVAAGRAAAAAGPAPARATGERAGGAAAGADGEAGAAAPPGRAAGEAAAAAGSRAGEAASTAGARTAAGSRSLLPWLAAAAVAVLAAALALAAVRGRRRRAAAAASAAAAEEEIAAAVARPAAPAAPAVPRGLAEALAARETAPAGTAEELTVDSAVAGGDPDATAEQTRVLAERAVLMVSQPGDGAPRTFLLRPDRAFSVGRRSERNTLALPDPALSGQHFRIVPDEGRFYLLDLRSTNGTFVNGERAVVRELASGDVIHAGQIECSFRSFAQPMG